MAHVAPLDGTWRLRPDFLKRLAWTLGLLAVVPILCSVPLVGLNTEPVSRAMDEGGYGPPDSLRTLVSKALMLESMSIGAMGLDYLRLAFAFVLLARAASAWVERRLDGGGGWRSVESWAGRLMLPLVVLMAPFLLNIFAQLEEREYVPDPGSAFYISNLAALTGGSAVVLLIARKISQVGLGNGALTVLSLSPATYFLLALLWIPTLFRSGEITYVHLFVAALPLLLLVALTGVLVLAVRRIPVLRAKYVAPQGAVPRWIEIRPCPASLWPFLAAWSIADILPMVAGSSGFTEAAAVLQSGSWTRMGANLALTAMFAVLAARAAFNPARIAKDLREARAFIGGIRPGRKTEEYLRESAGRLHLAGIGLLVVIGLAEVLVSFTWRHITWNAGVPPVPGMAVVAVALWHLVNSARASGATSGPPPAEIAGATAPLAPAGPSLAAGAAFEEPAPEDFTQDSP